MICQFKSKHYIMFKQHILKKILLTCSWNTFIPSYWKIACLYFGKFREITDYLFPQLKSNCTTNSHDCEPINFFKFWLFYYCIMTWKNRIFKIDRKKIEHIGIPFLCMYMYIQIKRCFWKGYSTHHLHGQINFKKWIWYNFPTEKQRKTKMERFSSMRYTHCIWN